MICIVGAGAMGAALAVHLARSERHACVLATAYDGPFVDAHRRGEAHPGIGVPFPPTCRLHEHGDWSSALAAAELVVLAVSTPGLEPCVRLACADAPADALWVVATKGWDETTLRSAYRVVADELGDPKRVVALVGPSLATEIAGGVPTALVCASEDIAAAERVAAALASPAFRTYVSDDVQGVEVGAALKNVIAIAVGLCDALAGEGRQAVSNTKAFVFSRGLVEMARLAIALGGRLETVVGLTGAGDLYVTCLGGRNARFGALLAQGLAPKEALDRMRTTVEGYANARAAVRLAEQIGCDLPIVRAVARVLFDGLPPRRAIETLLGEAAGAELSAD